MQDIISIVPKRRTVIIIHWNSDISISVKNTNQKIKRLTFSLNI